MIKKLILWAGSLNLASSMTLAFVLSGLQYLLIGIKNLFLAVVLSPEQYGISFLSTTLVGLLFLFDFGILAVVHRDLPQIKEKDLQIRFINQVRSTLFVIAIGAVLLSAVGASISWMIDLNHFAIAFLLAAAIFPFQALVNLKSIVNTLQGKIALGQMLQLRATAVNIVSTVALYPLIDFLVVVIGPVLGYVTVLLSTRPKEILSNRTSFRSNFRTAKNRLNVTKVVGFTNILMFFYLNFGMLYLAVQINPTEFGKLSIASTLLAASSLLPVLISNRISSTINILFRNDNKSALKNLMHRTREMLIVSSTSLLLALCLFYQLLTNSFLTQYRINPEVIWMQGISLLLLYSTYYTSTLPFASGHQTRISAALGGCLIFEVVALHLLTTEENLNLTSFTLVGVIKSAVYLTVHTYLFRKYMPLSDWKGKLNFLKSFSAIVVLILVPFLEVHSGTFWFSIASMLLFIYLLRSTYCKFISWRKLLS